MAISRVNNVGSTYPVFGFLLNAGSSKAARRMSRSLAAYRKLLRSIKSTFKGDKFMQQGALVEVRRRYKESAGVTDPTEIERLASEGYEAADFLETFVVQAKLNKRGNFAMKVESHHAESTAEEAALRPES